MIVRLAMFWVISSLIRNFFGPKQQNDGQNVSLPGAKTYPPAYNMFMPNQHFDFYIYLSPKVRFRREICRGADLLLFIVNRLFICDFSPNVFETLAMQSHCFGMKATWSMGIGRLGTKRTDRDIKPFRCRPPNSYNGMGRCICTFSSSKRDNPTYRVQPTTPEGM